MWCCGECDYHRQSYSLFSTVARLPGGIFSSTAKACNVDGQLAFLAYQPVFDIFKLPLSNKNQSCGGREYGWDNVLTLVNLDLMTKSVNSKSNSSAHGVDSYSIVGDFILQVVNWELQLVNG